MDAAMFTAMLMKIAQTIEQERLCSLLFDSHIACALKTMIYSFTTKLALKNQKGSIQSQLHTR